MRNEWRKCVGSVRVRDDKGWDLDGVPQTSERDDSVEYTDCIIGKE